jgi:hypothetical protein
MTKPASRTRYPTVPSTGAHQSDDRRESEPVKENVQGLPPVARRGLKSERRAVGHEVTAAASQDATILLLAWAPGRRGPLPRGATATTLRRHFLIGK